MNLDLSLELSRAWRRLLNAPGFSLSVIVLIAFSIGGVAAVAAAGWSLFAKPLPYSQADQLVTVSVWGKRLGSHGSLSEALVEELNRENQFGTISLVKRPFEARIADGMRIRAARIDHRLLDVLRVSPRVGRGLSERDMAPGADPVALVSERFWRHNFGGDAELIGRVVDLEAGRVRIVGVVPDALGMPDSQTDLWLPMELGPGQLDPARLSQLWSDIVVARMDQGVDLETYRAQLLGRLRNDQRLSSIEESGEQEFMVRPLRELWSGGQRDGLLILAIATAVVLVAAWLNLAGLWLARWMGRTHELAIQFALGARQGLATIGVVLEYALLAIPGLVLAMVVSGLGLELLYTLGVLDDTGPLRAGLAVPMTIMATLLLAFGLLPVLGTVAWNMRRMAGSVAGNLGGRGTAVRGRGMHMRKLLMIGQIGIACSLLLALGLLVSSWLKLLNEDLGFDSGRLILAMVGSSESGQSGPDAAVAAAVERLEALPGVEAVSWSNIVPFSPMEILSGVVVDERPDEPVPARPHLAGPEFFQVAGIGILGGRTFGPEDAGGTNVIVDKTFERMYLDNAAPGRRVGFQDADLTVVGVVESVRHISPDEAPNNPTIYTYSAAPGSQVQLLLRTSIDPESVTAAARDLLEQRLGADRVSLVTSLEARVRHSVSDREPQLVLLATFAGLALLLVFFGLYALQSYQVTCGTAEIGLRRAMGASRSRIVGAELARAARLLPSGLGLGMLGGWFALQLIDERLYKVGLADPELWLATGAAIALTVVMASLVPALRASRIEPLEALRHE